MKRILVPVDFSPNSQKAFRYAVDIASRSGGTIFLYHLFRPLKASEAGVVFDVDEHNRHLKEIALKRLQRLQKKVLADTNVNVPVAAYAGRIPVVKNILDFADENNIDLVVMGTKGASGLKKITIGSNASKIIRRAKIPVLLIPEKFKWETPGKILFTTAIQKSDSDAIPVLSALSVLYDAKISMLHLRDPHQPETMKDKKEFERHASTMQKAFKNTRLELRQIDTFSISKTLQQLHKEIPYDILVMIRRRKSLIQKIFVESFTKNMAFITNKPLLIIPQDKKTSLTESAIKTDKK
ncbi:MAG: universal stress protein [Ginsengibacter sp.]